MGGYILAQKLEIERSKSFAGSILLQTKAISSYCRVPLTGIDPQVSGNKRQIGQNHDSLKTVSPTLSVLK